MSLQWRLVGALLMVVIAAVGGGTAAHLVEISRELEAGLQRQSIRVMESIQSEFENTSEELDQLLRTMVHSRQMKSWFSRTREGRITKITDRFQLNNIDVVKVLDSSGKIMVSTHWSASFGALDPNMHIYSSSPGTIPRIVDEPLPSGTALALQRWAVIKVRDKEFVLVAGKFLGESSLEKIRATVGADVLALCRHSFVAAEEPSVSCFRVGGDSQTLNEPFSPESPTVQIKYLLNRFSIGGDVKKPTLLIAGMDRESVEMVRDGIMIRALAIGTIAIFLALVIGFFLASRIVRPLTALVGASNRWAEGELTTRVDLKHGTGGKEERKLVESFNRMAADLGESRKELMRAERVAAWQEIAQGLAHELKNPLTPIRVAMEVIRKARKLDREDFDDILDEQSEAVLEEVIRLKELSDAFARFARLPDPKHEDLLLQDVVENALSLYASGHEKLLVEKRYDDAFPTIRADRTQLATAITNLVKNAVEAVDGVGTLLVSLSEVADVSKGAKIEIAVEDSGPGLAKDILDRVFTPYFTTKGSRGTGLGLALVHRIVAEHGGQIEVGRSVELGGARFSVRLPREPKPPKSPS